MVFGPKTASEAISECTNFSWQEHVTDPPSRYVLHMHCMNVPMLCPRNLLILAMPLYVQQVQRNLQVGNIIMDQDHSLAALGKQHDVRQVY